MHGGHQFGRDALDRLGNRAQRQHFAPRRVHGVHLGAEAAQDFGEQQAEAAEVEHQHAVAGADQRHQRGFDAGACGAIDQKRPAVVGAEQWTVQRHHLVHVGGHFRIELAQQIGCHRAQHARMRIDRARAHQQALRWIEFAEGVQVAQIR